MRKVFAAALAAASLVACSEGTEPQAAAPAATVAAAPEAVQPAAAAPERPRVLDTFEVGANVYVRALAVAPETRKLWVGTSLGAHLVDLDSLEPENTFTRDNGLANEYVFAALVDSAGNAWLGTNGGGVSRYRGGEWRTWFPMHGLADYWVYAFAEAAPGTLWIGTWAGANRLDVASGTLETFYEELVNEWVYGIDVDSRGRVWFGTEGGVSMLDGETWTEWTHGDGVGAPNAEGLPPSTNTGLGTRARHDLDILVDGRPSYNPGYIFCIRVASDDTVWAGTWGGGASRFDGSRWTNFTSADGLAGNVVFAIAEDRRGGLWFGTDDGLSHFDGREWHTFGTSDGLPRTAIYAIAEDPAGDIWAGGRGFVARIGTERTDQ